jgi:hypothetical protein
MEPATTTQHEPQQLSHQARVGFKKGRSGNPAGTTRTQERLAELVSEFRRVQGCEPTVVQMVTLRNAAAIVARLARPGSNEDLVRLSAKLMARLGLDAKPEAPTGARHVPLRERLPPPAKLKRAGPETTVAIPKAPP